MFIKSITDEHLKQFDFEEIKDTYIEGDSRRYSELSYV